MTLFLHVHVLAHCECELSLSRGVWQPTKESILDRGQREASDISVALHDLSDLVSRVDGLFHQKRNVWASKRSSSIQASLDESICDFRKLARNVRSKVKDYANMAEDVQCTNTERRILTNQVTFLTAKLNDTITRMRSIQASHQTYFEKNHARQVCIVTSSCKSHRRRCHESVEGDEVDEVLLSPTTSSHHDVLGEQVFRDLILGEVNRKDQKRLHKDICNLESSLGQLKDIVLDMSDMVKTQGETISSIEASVASASCDVDAALPELKQARKIKRRLRWKKVMLIVGIVMLVIVCGVVIAVIIL